MYCLSLKRLAFVYPLTSSALTSHVVDDTLSFALTRLFVVAPLQSRDGISHLCRDPSPSYTEFFVPCSFFFFFLSGMLWASLAGRAKKSFFKARSEEADADENIWMGGPWNSTDDWESPL